MGSGGDGQDGGGSEGGGSPNETSKKLIDLKDCLTDSPRFRSVALISVCMCVCYSHGTEEWTAIGHSNH